MPDVAIKLLIIDPSREDTESYTNNLRNAGMAVHAERVDQEEDLLEAIKDHEVEIVIYSDQAKNIDLSKAFEICAKHRPDLPFIVVHQDNDSDLVKAAMQQGVRDFIPSDDTGRMQFVIDREYKDLLLKKELEQVKKELKESEERCATLIESSQNAIAYAHEGMHIHANPQYLNMFGYADMDDIEGLPIMDMVVPDHHAKFKEFLRALNSKPKNAEIEVCCQSSDGASFDALLEFSPARIDDEPCTQIVIRNQTPTKELEKKIQTLTLKDAHTGLYNREYFLQQLDEIIGENSWSLLYLIIDDFKDVRSNIGIIASDNLLKEIAANLEELVSRDDLLARFADHSFTLLCNNTAQKEIETLASTLCKAVADYAYEGSDQLVNPTCSIGIALPQEDISSQELINHAYSASEHAREEGGDCCKLYDASTDQPEDEEKKGSESDIQELLKHALENDRLRLVYQPVVSLQGDTRENYAVLTRLLDKNDEEIMPDYFIDEARQAGMMTAIDHWVINNAIRELAQQRKEGRKVNFFISISDCGIADETTLLKICDCLRDHQAKGAWLTFQFIDADLRANIQEAKKLVEGLKKIKCQIAVTHYGMTPKGETLLKHLPVDFVKLHPSLMENLATSQEQQTALNETNELIHSHDIKTVATAVEDANSLAILWTAGINYIQGYFLQEPSESISYDFNNPS